MKALTKISVKDLWPYYIIIAFTPTPLFLSSELGQSVKKTITNLDIKCLSLSSVGYVKGTSNLCCSRGIGNR